MNIKDFKRVIMQNLGYIAVGIVCLIFMLTAFLEMGRTGKTVGEIITDSAVCFLLGCFINRILEIQGIFEGERDERVIKTLKLHDETVARVSPHIELLDEWCEGRNKVVLKMQRTKILACECIKYSDCFDEDGVAIPFNSGIDQAKTLNEYFTARRRRRYYEKAVHLKLTPLTASDLTSEGGRSDDPHYLGRTKAQYATRTRVWDIAMRIGTSLVFGYYGVELIQNFSYATLIWRAMQISMLLLMGIITKNMSYMFMTDEYRGRVVKKIDYLIRFENDLKKSEPPPEDEPDPDEEKEEEKEDA